MNVFAGFSRKSCCSGNFSYEITWTSTSTWYLPETVIVSVQECDNYTVEGVLLVMFKGTAGLY